MIIYTQDQLINSDYIVSAFTEMAASNEKYKVTFISDNDHEWGFPKSEPYFTKEQAQRFLRTYRRGLTSEWKEFDAVGIIENIRKDAKAEIEEAFLVLHEKLIEDCADDTER